MRVQGYIGIQGLGSFGMQGYIVSGFRDFWDAGLHRDSGFRDFWDVGLHGNSGFRDFLECRVEGLGLHGGSGFTDFWDVGLRV